MVEQRSGTSAPGMSVAELISITDPTRLAPLCSPSVLELLVLLDPALASPGPLKAVIARLIDPATAVRTRSTLTQLLSLLPLAKADELARGLRLKGEHNVYRLLAGAAQDPSNLDTFLSFFGIVDEEHATGKTSDSVAEIKAAYGLFDHQRRAARRVSTALAVHPFKLVLHMPTGAGKTRTAMHVVAEHLAQRERTVICWLAANPELLEQAAVEFAVAWKHLGNRTTSVYRFWGDHAPDLMNISDGIVIGGLAKLYALSVRDPMTLLRLGDRTSLTVVDEAHQSIAPTYRHVITTLSTKRPASALLGLTATPGRTWADVAKDAELSEFFDNAKISLEVDGFDDPVDYLIAEGYLARPQFRALYTDSRPELTEAEKEGAATAADIPESVLAKLGEDARRNLLIVRAAEDLRHRHTRVLVFAASVASARTLSAILSIRGHESYVLTGETDTLSRERIVRKFKGTSPLPITLCNFGVLTTGFDAPRTSAAIIARPTKSLVLYSQMVGRATRGVRAGGNRTAEIITVVDPGLPGFGSIAEAFKNWEDVWHEPEGD